MLAFQTAPIVNIIDTTKICGCCKDDLEDKDDNYAKLSCGHEYHYDCIYYAFDSNKHRTGCVLECPYCRAVVKPLAEKNGFQYCNTIHGGLQYIPGISDKWGKVHKGISHCVYKNTNGLFCNTACQSGGTYCYSHANVVHKGANCCCFKYNEFYCNKYVSVLSKTKKYCYGHYKYEDAKECVYEFASGMKKGKKCGKYCWPTEAEPAQLCNGHIKYKTKLALKKEAEINNVAANPNGNTCQYIFKRGENKGKICGLNNCVSHNNSKISQPSKVSTINSTAVQYTIDNSSGELKHKLVSLVNVAEPPIIVHVEKSAETVESGSNDYKLDSLFKIELKQLLTKIIPNVSSKEQKEIEQFIHKYNLE